VTSGGLLGVLVLAGCGSEEVSTQNNEVVAQTQAIEVVPGEMLVKLNDSVPKHAGKSVSKSLGMPVVEHFEELGISHIQVPVGSTPEDIKKLYGDTADVVEPNYVIRTQAVVTPNESFYGLYQWDMAKIGMPNAWSLSQGVSSNIIGIIDTGIAATHTELSGNWSGYFKNVVSVQQLPFDDNGHGTQVAGVIAARGNNGSGIAGVNWSTKIAACKAFNATGSGSVASAIACVEYFNTLKTQGVNIVAVNESWGFRGESQILRSALAANGKLLHVVAAGNDGTNNDNTPMYPAAYQLPNMIAVAATTKTDLLSSYSNYGRRTASMSAPGDSIITTSLGNTYVLASGTSLAVPHVTGAIGLIAAKNPTMTPSAMRNLVMSSGDAAATLAPTTVSGKRLNVSSALACTNKPLFSLLTVPTTTVNGSLTYSIISTNCADAVSPVIATINGVPTQVQNTDGIATFTFKPTVSVNKIAFSSAAGTETVNITVHGLPVTGAVAPVPAGPLSFVTPSVIPLTKGGVTSIQAITGGTPPYAIMHSLPAGYQYPLRVILQVKLSLPVLLQAQ
jgi:subtilisin family serine protease